MVDRITWWLEHNLKLPNTQFGFRTGKNTSENLIVVAGEIYIGFAEGEYTITAYLDIKDAFEHVNPDKLLTALIELDVPTSYCLFFYYHISLIYRDSP